MEKCVKCGSESTRRHIVYKSLVDFIEVPLCNKCYEEYTPSYDRVRGDIVFKPYRRVYFSMLGLMVESKALAKAIERVGRSIVGKIVTILSTIGIPASMLALIFMLYCAVSRLLNPLSPEWIDFSSKLPKGYGLIMVPGLDPMLPLLQGWIAIIITVTFHEFFHGVVATYQGRSLASAGVVVGPIPIAYVKVTDAKPRDLRIYSAGVTANLLISVIAFSILAMVKPLPEIFLKNPLLFLVPIDIFRLKGLSISFTFSESLLYYVGLLNMWAFISNSIPFLITDGTYILAGVLNHFMKLRKAMTIAQLFSVFFISSIVFLAILQLIVQYGV